MVTFSTVISYFHIISLKSFLLCCENCLNLANSYSLLKTPSTRAICARRIYCAKRIGVGRCEYFMDFHFKHSLDILSTSLRHTSPRTKDTFVSRTRRALTKPRTKQVDPQYICVMGRCNCETNQSTCVVNQCI